MGSMSMHARGMGLVAEDGGWRVTDQLWAKIEPLLPPRPKHPLGLPQPSGARSRCAERDSVRPANGPNPTDRAKGGSKRSLLTEAAGIPVGLPVAGANRVDFKLARETLESIPLRRPRPT